MKKLLLAVLLLQGLTLSQTGNGVMVSGRVLLAPGTLASNGGRVIMRAPDAGSLNTTLRPDNTFEVSGVLPGTYMVEYRSGNVTASLQITVAKVDIAGIELVDLDWVRNSKGLQQVWTASGRYRGLAWDSAAAVIHAANANNLTDLDAAGKITKQTPLKNSPNLRIAHFANQGTVLLAFGTWSSSVDAYDLSGKQIWSYAAGAIDDVWARDLDSDGSDEVVVGFNGGVGLHVLDSTGKLLWKDSSIANVWHVAASDVRGEGRPQVISTSATGQVHVFSSDGKQRVNLLPGFYANMIRTGRIAASDAAETIFIAGTQPPSLPTLAALSGDGTRKWTLELADTKAIYSAYFASGKPWLALGMQGGQVEIVDAAKGVVIASIDGQGFDPEMTWINVKDSNVPLLAISTGNKLTAYRIVE